MSSRSFGFTAPFMYIDEALRAQWSVFIDLQREMDNFVPKPASSFQPKMDAEFERLQALNPGKPEPELRSYVDRQHQFLASSDWQFTEAFGRRHTTLYVTTFLLSSALCEALANAVLALGLADANNAELFSVLESSSVVEKWALGPRAFSSSYRFPVGTALDESLRFLIGQRNHLMHLKIEVTVDGTKVLPGSPLKRQSIQDEVRWLRRAFSLPYDLSDWARAQFPGKSVPFLFDRRPIEAAAVHAAAYQIARAEA